MYWIAILTWFFLRGSISLHGAVLGCFHHIFVTKSSCARLKGMLFDLANHDISLFVARKSNTGHLTFWSHGPEQCLINGNNLLHNHRQWSWLYCTRPHTCTAWHLPTLPSWPKVCTAAQAYSRLHLLVCVPIQTPIFHVFVSTIRALISLVLIHAGLLLKLTVNSYAEEHHLRGTTEAGNVLNQQNRWSKARLLLLNVHVLLWATVV